jgi:uncharacterized protein (DUF427 family)
VAQRVNGRADRDSIRGGFYARWAACGLNYDLQTPLARKESAVSSTKEKLIPGPDHPITVTPTDGHVVARVGGQVIAESDRSLTLQEASYPPIQYLPLADVDPAVLRSTDHQTYCPYKGDASYYTVTTASGDLDNAIWSYRKPYEAVSEIADHVAFYPDRIEVTVN